MTAFFKPSGALSVGRVVLFWLGACAFTTLLFLFMRVLGASHLQGEGVGATAIRVVPLATMTTVSAVLRRPKNHT
jgi:hypothetical protein